MTISTVTPYVGSVPNRATQSQTEFSSAANTWTSYQAVTLVPSINVTIGQMNTDIATVNTNATAAQNAADAAAGAANFKGKWSSLSGVLNIPASVSHEGSVWVLLNNLSNVASSEPSLTNSDWLTLNPQQQITNNVVSHWYRNR